MPSAGTTARRSLPKDCSKDGTKYLRPSKRWYFGYQDAKGTVRRTKGFTDLKATEQLAAECERKESRIRTGIIDPTEEQARRPLADHLADYAAHLEAKGGTSEHVAKTIRRIRALCSGAGFVFPRNVDATKTIAWPNGLRRNGEAVTLPEGDSFAPGDVAKLLGITTTGLAKNIERHGLQATGNGKARRIPRSTLEALAQNQPKGVSPETVNHFIRAARGFFRWLVTTKRFGTNPLETPIRPFESLPANAKTTPETCVLPGV